MNLKYWRKNITLKLFMFLRSTTPKGLICIHGLKTGAEFFSTGVKNLCDFFLYGFSRQGFSLLYGKDQLKVRSILCLKLKGLKGIYFTLMKNRCMIFKKRKY